MPESGTAPDSAQSADASPPGAVLRAGARQNAMFTSANVAITGSDESAIVRPFNVGAERMLGYDAPTFSIATTPETT